MGIKVEEISGYEQKSGKVWCELAKQVYCENGKNGYRFLEHFPSGAPFLDGENSRISISHTNHLLVVASLPSTPEVDLSVFSPRTALGIDAEKADRTQVLKIREKFLSEEELRLIADSDIINNIVAWTAKEALYKAALISGIEFKSRIAITAMPDLKANGKGAAIVTDGNGSQIDFLLYSYESDGYIISIAYSPKSATFKKRK